MIKRLLYIIICLCFASNFTACSYGDSDNFRTRETGETSVSGTVTVKSAVTLVGSWSPNIDAAEPEIVEFQYSEDKNAVERLFYTHIHTIGGINYHYSTGTVDEYSGLAICMPVRKPNYTYFSFDLSELQKGIIYDEITDVAFHKISDDLYLDPNSLNNDCPVDFSAGWPELEESMNEWFGYDYIIMTEGDRIWAHGCDKDYYDYVKSDNDANYEPDTYRSVAQDSAQFLYSYAQNGNVKNPRVIFIVSGETYNMDSTLFVFVNGYPVYDYENETPGPISWG